MLFVLHARRTDTDEQNIPLLMSVTVSHWRCFILTGAKISTDAMHLDLPGFSEAALAIL